MFDLKTEALSAQAAPASEFQVKTPLLSSNASAVGDQMGVRRILRLAPRRTFLPGMVLLNHRPRDANHGSAMFIQPDDLQPPFCRTKAVLLPKHNPH